MKVTVMTYNIHHGQGVDGRTDIGRIAREIEASGADIAALQEVDRFHPRSFLHDQVRRLTRRLQMDGAFAPSINLGLTQYGNAIISRFPLLSKKVTYMQGVSERRSILTVRLETSEGPLTVIDTHIGILAREKLRQMRELRKELASAERPALLLGDFNMTAGDPLLQELPGGWRKVRLQDPMPTHVYGREIDHIFTNAFLKKGKAWVRQSLASDHHGVVAELEW